MSKRVVSYAVVGFHRRYALGLISSGAEDDEAWLIAFIPGARGSSNTFESGWP